MTYWKLGKHLNVVEIYSNQLISLIIIDELQSAR